MPQSRRGRLAVVLIRVGTRDAVQAEPLEIEQGRVEQVGRPGLGQRAQQPPQAAPARRGAEIADTRGRIAEQHAVTFASGRARAGLKPVIAIYSTFLQRFVAGLLVMCR